jgi:hypothetical protein
MYLTDDDLLDESRQDPFSKLREQIGMMLDYTGREETFLSENFYLNGVDIQKEDENPRVIQDLYDKIQKKHSLDDLKFVKPEKLTRYKTNSKR